MRYLILFILLIVSPLYSCLAQTIVTSYEEKYQDTVYVYNGDFLYDHSGTFSTQVFAECIGKKECRLYFRLNDGPPSITYIRNGYAFTMETKYSFSIKNWNYEKTRLNSNVYTFDIPISREVLKEFAKTEILRFKIGNHLFTATDDIRYGLGRLYSKTESNVLRNGNISDLNNPSNKNDRVFISYLDNTKMQFEFNSVKVAKEDSFNSLIVTALVDNPKNEISIFSPTEIYLANNPKFNPQKYDGPILSYLSCEVLPKDNLINKDGTVKVDKKWKLPTKVYTSKGDSVVDITNYKNLSFNSLNNSDSGQVVISVGYIVPEKHTRCFINFLGTRNHMDNLLISHGR
jgi:hypothetical protein